MSMTRLVAVMPQHIDMSSGRASYGEHSTSVGGWTMVSTHIRLSSDLASRVCKGIELMVCVGCAVHGHGGNECRNWA